jgi:hypothetical protein
MSKSRHFRVEGAEKNLAKSFFLTIFVRRKDRSDNEKNQSTVAVAYNLLEGRVMLLSSDVLPYKGPECFGAFLFSFYEED